MTGKNGEWEGETEREGVYIEYNINSLLLFCS